MCRRDFGSMVSIMGKAFLKGIISSTEGEVSRTAFHSVCMNDCCFTQLPEVLGHCCVKDIFCRYCSHFLYNFMFLCVLNAYLFCIFILLTDFRSSLTSGHCIFVSLSFHSIKHIHFLIPVGASKCLIFTGKCGFMPAVLKDSTV